MTRDDKYERSQNERGQIREMTKMREDKNER